MSALPAGLPIETVELIIGGVAIAISAVRNQDVLLDAASAFAQVPYGLLLWESAVAMAEVLATREHTLAGLDVLELGSGTGLAGLVARRLGAGVTQTDHEPAALALARANAERNGVAGIAQFAADWRSWQHTRRYDLLLGADIVYEREAHAPLAAIFARNLAPGGEILLTDPGRPHTLDFLARLEDAGWRIDIEVRAVADLADAQKSVEVWVVSARRPRT